jgi:hypothetical protein
VIGEDRAPADPAAWRGEASDPAELADEFSGATIFSRHFPHVEPIALINVTMSLANRDLVIEALRRMAQKNYAAVISGRDASRGSTRPRQ